MRWMILFALALLTTAAHPGSGTCGALLNEVMADPASDWDGDGAYNYEDDEWVEIYNPGPEPLDLAGWFLGDQNGGFVYGFAGTVDPGDVRVVYGSEAEAWEAENGQSTTGLRLGNDGDTVTLWQVVGEDTLLIDSYTYETWEAEDDRASGRRPDGGADWEIFDALNPYGGDNPPPGNGLPPTPGSRNDESPVPAAQGTWGRVKALYRTS